ncbi:MAG TPA: DUF4136 domain-containing protein [Burkholderiaceae bacterium]|jgi:hypothetical protein
MERRHLVLGLGALPFLGLAACTGPYNVTADVSSFGDWPADRTGGTYSFERLPSQEKSKTQGALEDAAREALERAGLRPAAEGAEADVTVALGMRYGINEAAPWDDPLWWRWHAGFGYWRRGGAWWGGPGPYPWGYRDVRYYREAAVLLRERKSGKPLYEAHACNDGITMGDDELPKALFLAALAEFPKTEGKPHRVSVTMPGRTPTPAK